VAGASEAVAGGALLLEVDGIIGPASSDFIVRGIDRAEATGAELLVIRMNTPGGLDSSMRDIIKRILSASVPVATYVAPPGSRAASAGTYILYASHIAAMAPATNLGAATPVQLSPVGLPGGGAPSPPERASRPGKNSAGQEPAGKKSAASRHEPRTAMERKIVNDAVAYIRGLATLRGRNREWAERAVREGVSLPADEALAAGVIDLIAPDVTQLLERLDGRVVKLRGRTVTLHVKGAPVTVIEPDWKSRLLAIVTNPNVAYILMLLGVYGLFFELSNPGTVLPGVAGAISLLLALYAFQVLPVNYAGVALVLVGIAFMVSEVFVPSFGALGIGGAVAFVVGSMILLDTGVAGYTISLPLVIGITVLTAAFVMTVLTMAVRQRRRPVVSGREEMVGSDGEAVEAFDGRGRILVHGEVWQARAAVPVDKGQRVTVRQIDGLVLVVAPAAEES